MRYATVVFASAGLPRCDPSDADGATRRHLAQLGAVGLDAWPGWGIMKQSRETAPIWVWLAFGLVGLAVAGYLAGYLVLEDILGYLK
jgi:hypothetical protein